LIRKMSEAQNIMETINTKGANPKIVKKLMMTMQEMGADFTEMTGKPPPGPLMMLGGKKLENGIMKVVRKRGLMSFTKLAMISRVNRLLNEPGNFTVFVPADSADLSPETMTKLMMDTMLMKRVIKNHIIADNRIMASDITDGAVVHTLIGTPINFVVMENGTVSLNGGVARVIEANIMAANGVIHIIDQVLMPPAEHDMSTPHAA